MSTTSDKLLELINRTNGTHLTQEQVRLTQLAVENDHSLTLVSAVPGHGLLGDVDVTANMINVAVLFQSINVKVKLDVVEGMSTDDLLPFINKRYGTEFGAGDFVLQPLDETLEQAEILMTVTPGNLGYKGSFTVTVIDDFVAALMYNGAASYDGKYTYGAP